MVTLEASALELAVVGGVGALTGGVLTLLGGAVHGHHATVARRAQQAHERRLASYRERVDAYDEILTFFSRVREELDNVILEDRPWDESVSGPDRRARLDALMQVHGSDAFRAITGEWRQAFDQTLYTLARWRWLDDPARDNGDETASVRAQLEKDQAKLQGVTERLQDQARRDVHRGVLEPASRAGSPTGPLRAVGTLMITAAVLLITAPVWRSGWPIIAQVAGAHRGLVAFCLLTAGFVIVLGGGMLSRRRTRESD